MRTRDTRSTLPILSGVDDIQGVLRARQTVRARPGPAKGFRWLGLVMVFALAACGGENDGEREDGLPPRDVSVVPSYPEGPVQIDADLPEGTVGPDERIAFYISLLGGGDQEEVVWGTEMLSYAGAKATAALSVRLAHGLERNFSLAENILDVFAGSVPGAAALPRILEAARHSSDRVRMAAATALGYLEDEKTIPVLLDLATDESPLVARAGLKALDRRKSAQGARGLRGRFGTTLSPSHRPTAVNVIARNLPKEEALSFLAPLLKSDDLTVAIPAARMLAEHGDDSGANVMHARYEKGDPRPQVMDALLHVLADLKDPRVVPILVEALAGGPLPRRITAAALLSSYRIPKVRDALRTAAKDPAPELKREAWHSLWLGEDPGAVSGLRLLLRSSVATDRRIAATLLGEIEAVETASDLAGALEHESDNRVVLDVAHGLAKLDRPETATSVVLAIERETQPVPSLAILANNVASAVILFTKISDEARTELARIATSKMPSHRLNAMRALMRHGRGEASRKAILAGLADEVPGVREVAAHAWMRFPGADTGPLLGMLENETDRTRARTIVDIARRLAHRWEE